MYNLFDNGTDVNFFMSPDRINDLMCLHITRDTEYDAVLGCQDRCVDAWLCALERGLHADTMLTWAPLSAGSCA